MVSMNKNYQFTEKILENVKDYLASVMPLKLPVFNILKVSEF